MFYIQQSLGIDFRDNQLRIVHLGKNLGAVTLLHTHTAKLPPRDIYSIDYEESIVAEVLNFIQQNRVKCDNVVLGIPRRDVIIRRISLPPVEKEDLRQIIGFEIERHIPFPSREVYFDVQILDQKPEVGISALVVAVRREIVDFYVNLLDGIGLTCSVVDVTNFSTYGLLTYVLSRRKLIGMETKGNCLMIDIGNTDVEINLIMGDRLTASRSVTKETDSESRLDLIVEGDFKSTYETPEEEETTLKDLELSQETNSLVEFLEEKSGELLRLNSQAGFFGDSNNKVFLFGADTDRPRLVDHFKARVDADVSLLRPLDMLPVPRNIKSEDLSGAFALALKGVVDYPLHLNLLPGLVSTDKKQKDPRRLTAALLIMVLIIGGVSFIGGYVRERRMLKEVTQKIDKIKLLGEKAIAMGKKVQELSNRKKEVEEFAAYKVFVTDLLLELTDIIPESDWIERMNLEKNELEIVGYANSASSLISILETSLYFEDVKFTSSITMRGLEKQKFKIKAKLEGKKVENILDHRKHKKLRKKYLKKG